MYINHNWTILRNLFVGLEFRFITYNQSSQATRDTGPMNAVDGNAITLSKTNTGFDEFWWGMLNAQHTISSIFVVVGKGNIGLL